MIKQIRSCFFAKQGITKVKKMIKSLKCGPLLTIKHSGGNMPNPAKGQHLTGWKKIRRVDHHTITLFKKKFHPRKRSARNTPKYLKTDIDPLLQHWDELDTQRDSSYSRYKQDYLYVLGEIMTFVNDILTSNLDNRYKTPTRKLKKWVTDTFLQIPMGDTYKDFAKQDINAFFADQPFEKRTCMVDCYLVIPENGEVSNYVTKARTEIQKQQRKAIEIFQEARIQLTFGRIVNINENSTTPRFTSNWDSGETNWTHTNVFRERHEGAAGLEYQVSHRMPTTKRINSNRGVAAIFVPRFANSGTAGFSYRIQRKVDAVTLERFFIIKRPIIVIPIYGPIILPNERAKRTPIIYTTVAHELGHVLTGSGYHTDYNPDNLMADGSTRSGCSVGLGLKLALRNNPAALNHVWPTRGFFESR